MGLGSFLKKGLKAIVDPFGIGGKAYNEFSGKNAAGAIDKSTQQQIQFQNRILDMYAPTVQAGQAQLPQLATSATVPGYSQSIGDILGMDNFGQLRQQRQNAATQQFASAGLRRAGVAGKAAADIDTDLAMQIEQELNNRRQSIAGMGTTGMSSSAGALGNIGSILGSGTLGKQEAKSAGFGNIMNIGATLLSSIFSDARLKTNAVKIGKIGPLDVWEWDWNDLAEEIGFTGSSTGFMAHEVMKTHPHRVIQAGELLKIDHEGLLEDLRNAYH